MKTKETIRKVPVPDWEKRIRLDVAMAIIRFYPDFPGYEDDK